MVHASIDHQIRAAALMIWEYASDEHVVQFCTICCGVRSHETSSSSDKTGLAKPLCNVVAWQRA